MGYIKRNCDCCKKGYMADERNLKRGWGLTCSKKCAAKKREKSKHNYNPERVARNNVRRVHWNNGRDVAPSICFSSGRIGGYTSEGYRVMDGVAYNEWDEPVYNV